MTAPFPDPRSRRAAATATALAALLLIGCTSEPKLPGERIPIRTEEAPLAQTDPKAVRPVPIPAAQANPDWSHRNGSAAGRLVNPAFSANPSLRWTLNIGEGDAKRRRLLTAPIVAGNLIYTIDAAGRLSAVTRGGQLAWSQSLVPDKQLADSGPGGGFSYDRGVLYVSTGFGDVLALDAATGTRRWSRSFDGPVSAPPTAADGRVYVVVRNDTAFALDAADGKTLWQTEGVGGTAGLMGGSSAATDGQLVVIPFISGEILGLVARNGLQVWGTVVTGGRRDLARNNINDISGDPVIDGATIYASNQSGRTVSLDRQSGERHWTLDEGAYGPAWPVGGSVFLMSDEGALVRVDAATGREIWNVQLKQYDNDKKRVSAVTHYGPVLAGGRLWVASGDEFLRAFNPSTGELLGTVALPGGAGAAPAVAGGVMYVVTRNGDLLAFQ
ncbi:MAG: PQQ-binding-like beta-propeller repeat protein [Amaricoccus sp.]